MTITDQAATIKFELTNGDTFYMDKESISIKKKFGFVHIIGTAGDQRFTKLKMRYSEVISPVVASNDALITEILSYKVSSGSVMGSVQITDGTTNLKIEEDGSMPVRLQDSTTPIIIAPFSYLEQATTTAVGVAIGDRTVTLTSVTGVSDNKLLTFFCPASTRFMIARCIGTPVGNLVTLDRYFDFAYTSGCYVDVSDTNLAVDGSLAPVRFGIRNNAGTVPPPGVELTMDVTRIIFQCLTTDLPELDMFGDILGGLTNGLFCRRRDGLFHNIFSAQTNGELAGIMYDLTQYDTTRFGTNGFAARLTFAGQNKLGATIRLAINEDMEIFVQDDLSSLLRLSIVAEGSVVEE